MAHIEDMQLVWSATTQFCHQIEVAWTTQLIYGTCMDWSHWAELIFGCHSAYRSFTKQSWMHNRRPNSNPFTSIYCMVSVVHTFILSFGPNPTSHVIDSHITKQQTKALTPCIIHEELQTGQFELVARQ